MTRALRFVTHNWPLKLAAIGLATLLYGGLVLSQTTDTFTGDVPIVAENAPDDVTILSDLGSVTRIRFVAPPDLGLRIDSASFVATVDLADVEATGGPVSVAVAVEAVDPRVQVLDYTPSAIVLTLDLVEIKSVPIRAVLFGPIPSGLEAADPVVEGNTATVRGPRSIVSKVIEAQARYQIEPAGIDLNQLVDLVPVDSTGEQLSPIDVEPTEVRVRVAVFSDRRSKTLFVTPNVVGTPAAGFEIAGIEVEPPIVSVEGDANDLSGLENADTEPISIAGASSTITQIVAFALPDGVQALDTPTVQVTIRLRSITATRTFGAGLVLVGARSDLRYALSTDGVLVTIGGPVADLDRLSGTTLALTVDVTGLEPGTHTVPVSANLQTGLTLVGASPNPIEVTIFSPVPSPGVSPGVSPGPSPTT